jgi:hypothetical protein
LKVLYSWPDCTPDGEFWASMVAVDGAGCLLGSTKVSVGNRCSESANVGEGFFWVPFDRDEETFDRRFHSLDVVVSVLSHGDFSEDYPAVTRISVPESVTAHRSPPWLLLMFRSLWPTNTLATVGTSESDWSRK